MSATYPKPELFVGADDLTITLESYQDISTATLKQVLATDPKGGEHAWPVTRLVGTQNAEYDVQPGNIDLPGQWKFQLHTIVGGKHGYGKIDTLIFKLPLNV